jgi:hypothetical protein
MHLEELTTGEKLCGMTTERKWTFRGKSRHPLLNIRNWEWVSSTWIHRTLLRNSKHYCQVINWRKLDPAGCTLP